MNSLTGYSADYGKTWGTCQCPGILEEGTPIRKKRAGWDKKVVRYTPVEKWLSEYGTQNIPCAPSREIEKKKSRSEDV